MGLNLQSGEMMAVKQIATNSDPEELKDLQDEINVMKKLSHRHIVSYLGGTMGWRDKGTVYLYGMGSCWIISRYIKKIWTVNRIDCSYIYKTNFTGTEIFT